MYTRSEPKSIEQLKAEILLDIEQIAGHPDTSLENTRHKFEEAYERMTELGENTAASRLVEAWDHISALHAQSNTAIDHAAAARKLAQELGNMLEVQEEAFAKTRTDYNNLHLAAHKADDSHPVINRLIQKLYDDITQEVAEGFLDQEGIYISFCPGCEIISHLNLPEDDHDTVRTFHDILVGEEDLTDDETNILTAFIHSFMAKRRARIERESTQQEAHSA